MDIIFVGCLQVPRPLASLGPAMEQERTSSGSFSWTFGRHLSRDVDGHFLHISCPQERAVALKRARRGAAWRGSARHGMAWHGAGCHDATWAGACRGATLRGAAWHRDALGGRGVACRGARAVHGVRRCGRMSACAAAAAAVHEHLGMSVNPCVFINIL